MNAEQLLLIFPVALGDQLYRHSLAVAEAAEMLACRCGVDPERAYLAGLVHDYGKRYSSEELLEKARTHGLTLDRLTRSTEKLLHAPVGAALVKSELGIDDPGIIRAVSSHTTGRVKMTLLEKVVYLADFIEAGRTFSGVEKIRKTAADDDLNKALLAAVNITIKSVLDRDLALHPRSVVFRNSLLRCFSD